MTKQGPRTRQANMESSRQTERRAAEWLAKQDGGDWSDADQSEMDEWLRETTHRVAYIRLRAAWNQTQRLKALGAGPERGPVPPPGKWQVSPFFEGAGFSGEPASQLHAIGKARHLYFNRRSLFALAASLLLAFATGAIWYLRPTGATYSTPVGGLASVPMTDGSKVTLNTDSEIRVAVTETERHVELKQGEAFFEVAKDPTRPFVVRAGDRRVIAVGTKFSVLRDKDDVRVVVTEGKVRIEDSYQATGSSDRSLLPAISFLRAGNIARAGQAGVLVQEKPLPETEEYLSWRDGYVVFRDTPLADAIAEFNRYNTHKIVIQDPEVAAIKLSGNFRSTSYEAFVRLLQDGFPIAAHSDGDNTVLTKN